MARAELVIGLVNGMPVEARAATERQFRGILDAAGEEAGETVTLHGLPLETAHPDFPDLARLEALAPDALVVTGAVPRAAALRDEPFFAHLAAIADFALAHAVPVMWSCLAAHAAVLHLDGIERRRLPQKLSGLVDCVRGEQAHPMARTLPARWRIPHSRYNDLPEAALLSRGYRLLSRSAEAGADIFLKDTGAKDTGARDTGAKDTGALFVFCQGHPEYDADTLLREYRRDIRQYLRGERAAYPAAPRGLFSPATGRRLVAFRARAVQARGAGQSAEQVLADFPWAACAGELRHGWHDLAISLYANWLICVAEAGARKIRPAIGRQAAAASALMAGAA